MYRDIWHDSAYRTEKQIRDILDTAIGYGDIRVLIRFRNTHLRWMQEEEGLVRVCPHRPLSRVTLVMRHGGDVEIFINQIEWIRARDNMGSLLRPN